jgi:hypothetical protein
MSILDVDKTMNEMDHYADAMAQWNEAYEKFLDENEINRMFEFFAKHCPHKNKFIMNYTPENKWSDIEKKLGKPFGVYRYNRGYIATTYDNLQLGIMVDDFPIKDTMIKYNGTWYSFPSSVYIKDAVIPEWFLHKDEYSNKVNILDAFWPIYFYLDNCLVPEGFLPPNVRVIKKG